MRRLYQTEWHDIPFFSFAPLSAINCASASFYAAFYKEFFNRYASYDAIAPWWRELKGAWVQCITDNMLPSNDKQRVLSVGCGIGYIEHILQQHDLQADLHVTEVTDIPLRWIQPLLAPGHCHVGYAPECLPPELAFDMIYCASIDYAMSDAVWVDVMHKLVARLRPGGTFLVLTASLDTDPIKNFSGHLRYMKNECKLILKHLLGRSQVQFWGYKRSLEENLSLCHKAGLKDITYGPLGDNPSCMWIAAKV